MSRKLTSKCDGCGVEVVEDDDLTMGVLGAIQRRRHSSEHWGSLRVSVGTFPVSFDLCETCTKRVVALLELELPKLGVMQRGVIGGLGGHAMPFMPGDFMAPPSAPPWAPPMTPGDSPFGALTPEDLKALGIEMPSVTPADAVGPYTCPGCGTLREGPVPGFACAVCKHQD